MRKLALLLILLLAAPVYAQPPGAPQNLSSTVSGSTVTLTWSPPASGAPASYVVEASVIPGGPLVATLPVTTTSLTVPGVPSGVYYVHVRSVAGASVSAPSNQITVTVTDGCPAPPVPPQLILRVVGFDATVSWGSGGGCAPTSYTLLVGSAPGLSDVVQVNAGSQLGFQAVAPPGTYYVRLIGTNAYGSSVSEELVAPVAFNAQTDTVLPNGAVSVDITMQTSGIYQPTLVWTDPSIDLDLYLTTPDCGYPPTGCLLAISDATGTNSEAVSWPVTAGQTYRLWVDNFTQRTTSFTIYNVVAPAATAAAQGEAISDTPGNVRVVKYKP